MRLDKKHAENPGLWLLALLEVLPKKGNELTFTTGLGGIDHLRKLFKDPLNPKLPGVAMVQVVHDKSLDRITDSSKLFTSGQPMSSFSVIGDNFKFKA